MTVREALVSDPRVLSVDAGLSEAALLLLRPEIKSVLVVDGDRLVGAVGPEGVIEAVAKRSDLDAVRVGDICRSDLITMGPDASLDDAVRLMSEHGLKRIPIVDDGRLLGVVAREPLVRRLAEDEAPPPPEDLPDS